MTSKEFREIGNKYYKEHKLNLAIENYSKAIEIDSNDYQSYTNRSLSYFQKKEYEKSLDDAKQAIKINSQWDKANYRLAMALKQMNKFDESLRSLYIIFNKYSSNGINNVDGIDLNLIKKEIDTIQKSIISKNYSKSIISECETSFNSINGNVKVDYINANLGKSVFLTRSIDRIEPIISELPLVSSLHMPYLENDNYKSCFHCLKSIYVDKSCYTDLMSKQDELFSNKTTITCDKHCKFEVYCSENCKTIAWNQYHNLLCSNYDLVLKLYGFCRIKNQLFPILIMKMILIIISNIKNNKKSLQDSLSTFTSFQYDLSNPTLSEDQLIGYAFLVDIFKSILKDDDNLFNELINKKIYYQFNSILQLNSSSIEPLSILEELIDNKVSESKLTDKSIKIGNEIIMIQDIGEFLEKHKKIGMSIKGVGLYRVINSINHSCDPNVVCSFTKNNHSMAVYPLSDEKLSSLKMGQELNISYINEDQSIDKRQKLLKENYLFNCNCKKCINKK